MGSRCHSDYVTVFLGSGVNLLVSRVVLEQVMGETAVCPSGSPPPPIPAPSFLGFVLFIYVCPSTQFTKSPSCVPGHTQPVPERSQTEPGGPTESGGQGEDRRKQKFGELQRRLLGMETVAAVGLALQHPYSWAGRCGVDCLRWLQRPSFFLAVLEKRISQLSFGILFSP